MVLPGRWLLADLDGRLTGAAQAPMSARERAVAIKKLLVATGTRGVEHAMQVGAGGRVGIKVWGGDMVGAGSMLEVAGGNCSRCLSEPAESVRHSVFCSNNRCM